MHEHPYFIAVLAKLLYGKLLRAGGVKRLLRSQLEYTQNGHNLRFLTPSPPFDSQFREREGWA